MRSVTSIIDGMTTSTSAEAARPRALVVIGGGSAMPHHAERGIDTAARDAFRKSLPAVARVLAWPAGDTSLRDAYRRDNPAVEWHGCDDLEALVPIDGPFDLIALEQGIDPFDDPAPVLRALRARAHPRTVLALNLRLDTSLAMLQRFVEADLTDSADGPLAEHALRHRSLASVTKLLMDAGWMPTLADACWDEPRNDPIAQGALALAAAVGIPAATAQRQWRMRRAIVHANAPFDATAFDAAPVATQLANFAVVVPTTRDAQLRVNVECSPGLREVGARVVSVRRAGSAADALQRALEHVHEDWVLLCHQDVYFPPSFGTQLAALLDAVPTEQRARTVIGFAGVGVDAATQRYQHAGFVIDRSSRFDNPANDAVVSIDELALVLPRESVLAIDRTLGWHLWATDLCLQAICTHRFFPRIVRLPLFHNSHTDHTLPAAFHASAAALAAKYPDFGPIHTLCGVIEGRQRASA
jgi:hypothetical protein